MNNSYEPPIFELAAPGRIGVSLPECDVPTTALPAHLLRSDELNELPELSETEVIRHFTRISQRNMCIDTTMYPLGSCTMKYNPVVSSSASRLNQHNEAKVSNSTVARAACCRPFTA